jgi:hypothetical protein
MIKYFCNPFYAIKSKMTMKTMFVFDSKGEFITDDENIIARANGFFDSIDLEAKEIGVRKAKTFYNPPITIEKNEPKEEKTRHCKKCDFTCDFQADMLKHYRNFHSKVSKEV